MVELPDEKKAIVPIELAQIGDDVIVPIELAQIPNVLYATGWSNHQLIMSRCKSDEQRLFYMLYAGREQLENKELQRALKTNAMSSILGSKDEADFMQMPLRLPCLDMPLAHRKSG